MTFDRFMKEFLAEEFKDFPNTVYKYDCWYSFTPQGVMHQVFVFHSRSGGIDLHQQKGKEKQRRTADVLCRKQSSGNH